MRRTIPIALAAATMTLGTLVPLAPASAAAVYTVVNVNDAGAGSLRNAIVLANASAGTDDIRFNIAGGGVKVINLVTDLPTITDPVKIKGYTQPGAAQAVPGAPAVLRIVLNASTVTYGLTLATNDSVIAGLVVRSAAGNIPVGATCANDGICVTGNHNLIRGNYVGTNHAGLVAQGNRGDGIQIVGDGNVVGGTDPGHRNVISANDQAGVDMEGDDNVVQGNLIGTDANGTAALGNGGAGVFISGNGNQVGDSVAGAANVVSGNGNDAVVIDGDDNTVEGNLIGTDATGAALLGNGDGVVVHAGGHNRVGGVVAGEGNVISGNGTGVDVRTDATPTLIQGNLIGTDNTGLASFAVGGGDIGIATESMTYIGGNVIARMLISGIDLDGNASKIQGNKIGTDATGAVALGNNTGLVIKGDDNLIGGAGAGLGNVISGNLTDGVEVTNLAAGNDIQGNLIGTTVSGVAPLGNGRYGVWIRSGGNTLGGHAAGERNVVAANGSDGVNLDSHDNIVEGNLIGVDATGAAPLGNAGNGVRDDGDRNRVGGVEPGAGNVIGANGGHGVSGVDVNDGQVVANAIGTDASGVVNLGNARSGVHTLAFTHMIGSIDPAVPPNTIAFNGADGVTVDSPGGTSANTIVRNVIYGNGGLGIDLNPNGVTANDALDADGGANDLQNHPVVVSATNVAGTTEVSWELSTLPSSKFRLEFFAVNNCDASGHGEARQFLGDALVTTGAGGYRTRNTPMAATATAGQYVVMTATFVSQVGPPLELGATSEFSACVLVT